jgi:CRISPR-associated protein Csm1
MEKDATEIQQLILDCQPDVDINLFQQYLDTNVIDFKNIYTVYSGGDDLVLIGPWETMIVFAILLNAKFREYTCQSKSFTLSAGLAFVKPKFPIATAIREADVLLEKSKSKGKNRITMFNTTIVWEKLPCLTDFFLFLNHRLTQNHPNLNTAFLHRVLRYHDLAKDFLGHQSVAGLKYVSLLSYDIGRNIVEYDKKGEISQGEEDLYILAPLMDVSKQKDSLIYNVGISVDWVLYRHRASNKDVE